MTARQIGYIVGAVVWLVLLFMPFTRWAVTIYPDNALWRDFVFGGGGLAGVLLCMWVGGLVGSFIASRLRR